MKNFVKVFMILFISQMTMCMNPNKVTRVQKQIGNLKIISEHLEQKNPGRHNRIQMFMLNRLVANKIVDTNTPGTLYILQSHDSDDYRFPVDSYHSLCFAGSAFIKNSKKAKNTRSTYAVSYNIPCETSSNQSDTNE